MYTCIFMSVCVQVYVHVDMHCDVEGDRECPSLECGKNRISCLLTAPLTMSESVDIKMSSVRPTDRPIMCPHTFVSVMRYFKNRWTFIFYIANNYSLWHYLNLIRSRLWLVQFCCHSNHLRDLVCARDVSKTVEQFTLIDDSIFLLYFFGFLLDLPFHDFNLPNHAQLQHFKTIIQPKRQIHNVHEWQAWREGTSL